MIMDYHYTSYRDHLVVHIYGNFVIQEAINRFSILLAYCQEIDCRKVIIDYRQVGNMPNGTLRYLYQFSIEDKYKKYMQEFNKSMLFASIHTLPSVETSVAERDTLLFNMTNHWFNNLEEARDWLQVKSPQSEHSHGKKI